MLWQESAHIKLDRGKTTWPQTLPLLAADFKAIDYTEAFPFRPRRKYRHVPTTGPRMRYPHSALRFRRACHLTN